MEIFIIKGAEYPTPKHDSYAYGSSGYDSSSDGSELDLAEYGIVSEKDASERIVSEQSDSGDVMPLDDPGRGYKWDEFDDRLI
jgi:hypothetical protein